jgi:cell division septation protein DedD
VFSLGILLDRATGAPDANAEDEDPLAKLDRAAELGGLAQNGKLAAAAMEGSKPAKTGPVVEPKSLTFPDTLAEYDSRPEVEAALAAAEAELAHPDPIPAAGIEAAPAIPAEIPSAAGQPSAAVFSAPAASVEIEIARPVEPAALPASVAAAPRARPTEVQRVRDPLIENATAGAHAPTVGVGSDGAYTLQVASYQEPSEAHALSGALRARGHMAFVLRAEVDGRGVYHRVRVGPFETMKAAEEYRAAFERDERMNTFVVRNK